MSDPTTKRAWTRIDPEHLAYARTRFAELASTGAVKAEIKAKWGVEYKHNKLHHYWTQANLGFGGKLARLTAIDQEIESGGGC